MLLVRKINTLPLLIRVPVYFFIVLLLIYTIGRPIQLYLGTLYKGDRAPYLQMPSPTAMTLRWQTQNAETGLINYGIQPDELVLTAKEGAPRENHEIRLTGLKPGTRYYYNIGTQNSLHYSGPDYWFVTPHTRDDPSPVRFIVLGDPGYPGQNQKNVRDAFLNWVKLHPREQLAPFDLLLTTGDNAYRSGTNEQFELDFFEPYETILRNVPVWPVYGNHDSRRSTFYSIFSLPVDAESGGVASGTEHYYSFDYNQVHFIILDTEDSDLSQNSPMLDWLKRDLKQNHQTWAVALFHHPPYTKGSHDSDDIHDSRGRMFEIRENVLPVLERGGVDLVLSGHSHMYERSHLVDCHYQNSDMLKQEMLRHPDSDSEVNVYKKSPDTEPHGGTIYAVVGSSSKLSGGSRKHPVMAVTKKIMGSMIIDIKDKKLEAYFISDKGSIEDTFSIIKSTQPVEPFKTSCKKS